VFGAVLGCCRSELVTKARSINGREPHVNFCHASQKSELGQFTSLPWSQYSFTLAPSGGTSAM
jgi:hypothetical protein